MFSNVIVDVSFPRRSLVFIQSCCELSSSFSETGSVAVGTIEAYIFFKEAGEGGVQCLFFGCSLSFMFVSVALCNRHLCTRTARTPMQLARAPHFE